MKQTQNHVEIDAVTVKLDGKRQVMFNVVVGMQDTPLISLEALRELRRLADNYIRLAEALGDDIPSEDDQS